MQIQRTKTYIQFYFDPNMNELKNHSCSAKSMFYVTFYEYSLNERFQQITSEFNASKVNVTEVLSNECTIV